MRRLMAVILVAALVAWALFASFTPLEPAKDLKDFGSLLGVLLFASAILERSLDVVFSLFRGEGAEQLDAELWRLRRELDSATPEQREAALGALASKASARLRYRAETRAAVLPAAFVVGVFLAAIGLRALASLFELRLPDGNPALGGLQASVFQAVDILLTGALLAGGSDGLHTLVTLWRDWMARQKPA